MLVCIYLYSRMHDYAIFISVKEVLSCTLLPVLQLALTLFVYSG